jgi:hypothetical protein
MVDDPRLDESSKQWLEEAKQKSVRIDSTTAGLFSQSQSFKGDSQYDAGLAYGINQDRLRANNQKWYDELGNQVVKTTLGMGLDLIENTGYIGDLLFDWDNKKKDYSNFLVELSKSAKQGLDEALPLYKKDPSDITDFSDSAWWIENGGGLVQSIGSFLVTGAAVGKGLGAAAKAFTQAATTGRLGSMIAKGAMAAGEGANALGIASAPAEAVFKSGQALAQLGTAATLTYTEGAMEATDVYKTTYEDLKYQGIGEEEAIRRASEAAAQTVKLNMWNVALNLTGISPLFKNAKNLSGLIESTKQAVKPTIGNYLSKLGIEGVQEGFEEQVNLWAREEGKLKGQLDDKYTGSSFSRFLQNAFSEEGGLNFALGFIGGVGQKVGMGKLIKGTYQDLSGPKIKDAEYLQLPNEEKAKYVETYNDKGEKEYVIPVEKKASNDDIEHIYENREAMSKINQFKHDINAITALQAEMTAELGKGNTEKVQALQQQLFDIGAARSIRNGMGEEFADHVQRIGSVDNTILDENGKTAAMRAGYAVDTNDNAYKQKAVDAAQSIRELTKEYTDLEYTISDPIIKDVVFRTSVQLHTAQSNYNTAHKAYINALAKAQKLTTDPNNFDIVESHAKVIAYESAISYLEDQKKVLDEAKDANPYAVEENSKGLEREIRIAKNLLAIEKASRDQRLKETNNKQVINENKAILIDMSGPLTAAIIQERIVNKVKNEYNEVRNNEDGKWKRISKEVIRQIKEKSEEVKQQKASELSKKIEEADKQEAENKKTRTVQVYTDIAAAKSAEQVDQIVNQANQEGILSDALTEAAAEKKEQLRVQQELNKQDDTTDKGYITKGGKYRLSIDEIDGKFIVNVETKDKRTKSGYRLSDKLSKPFDTKAEAEAYLNKIRNKDKAEKASKEETKTSLEEGKNVLLGTTVETLYSINPTQEEDLTKEKVKETNETISSDPINKYNQSKNHNVLVYVSQLENNKDKDAERLSPISDNYKINHSTSINVGTGVILRVDEKYSTPEEIAVGVYILGRVEPIAYLRDSRKITDKAEREDLLALKQHVKEQGSVSTTIQSKTNGTLAFTDNSKRLSKDIFFNPVEFAIAVNSVLMIDKDVPLGTPLNNKGTPINGFVHAIITSPTGNKYFIPVDTNRVSDELADSMAEGVILFLKYYQSQLKDKKADMLTISDEEYAVLEQISDDMNLTSMNGLSKYLSQFIYFDMGVRPSNLKGSKIEEINAKKGFNKYFVDVTNTGIAFVKPGEAKKGKDGITRPFEIGINFELTKANEEWHREKLKEIFKDKYMRMDVTNIRNNTTLKTITLKRTDGKLSYEKASMSMYDYILNNTSTNLVGHQISDKETTYFLHPSITIDTSFFKKDSKNAEKIANQNLEKGQKNVIIATSPTSTTRKSPYKRGTSKEKENTPSSSVNVVNNPTSTTDEKAEEVKKNC